MNVHWPRHCWLGRKCGRKSVILTSEKQRKYIPWARHHCLQPPWSLEIDYQIWLSKAESFSNKEKELGGFLCPKAGQLCKAAILHVLWKSDRENPFETVAAQISNLWQTCQLDQSQASMSKLALLQNPQTNPPTMTNLLLTWLWFLGCRQFWLFHVWGTSTKTLKACVILV